MGYWPYRDHYLRPTWCAVGCASIPRGAMAICRARWLPDIGGDCFAEYHDKPWLRKACGEHPTDKLACLTCLALASVAGWMGLHAYLGARW